MTPQELENLRLSARIVALEGFVVGIVSSLIRSQDARQRFVAKLDQWAATFEQVTFENESPEYSDLYAAELQASVESLVSLVKRKLIG